MTDQTTVEPTPGHPDPPDSSMSASELRTAAMRGLRWTVVARPIVEVALFGSMIVLARLIPPADFGRYAVAAIVTELIYIPGASIATALVQRPVCGREYMQTGYALAILAGLVLVGLTALGAKFIVAPIFDDRTADLVRLAALGTLINATNIVPLSILQRRLAFRRLSVIQVVGTLSRVGACIALAALGWNATALVVGTIIGTVVGTIPLLVWAPPPPPRLWREPTRELSRYGIPVAFAAVGWVGFRNCDYAIVGARLGALQAGFYYRAYTLGVEYQKKVSQVMNTMGFSLLARTRTAEEQNALRGRMVVLLTIILFPCLALLAIVAPIAIPSLFGPRWSAAVAPTQLLVIGGAATLAMDAVGAQFMAAGRTRAVLGFGWGHFITYAVAVFLVSPLGITAVAAAAATVHTAFLGVAYTILHRRDVARPLRKLWDDLAPATTCCAALAAAAIPAGAALQALGLPALPYLALVSTIGAAGYLAALRILYPIWFGRLRALVSQVAPQLGVRRRTPRVATPLRHPAA